MDKNNLLGLINAQNMTEQMVKDAREEQLIQVDGL